MDENNPPSANDLGNEVRALRKEIAKLNDQRFFRAQNKWFSLAIFNLLRGLFFGLGSVLGATLLVYFFVQFLQRIDFIPIIGEWAVRIGEIVTENLGNKP